VCVCVCARFPSLPPTKMQEPICCKCTFETVARITQALCKLDGSQMLNHNVIKHYVFCASEDSRNPYVYYRFEQLKLRTYKPAHFNDIPQSWHLDFKTTTLSIITYLWINFFRVTQLPQCILDMSNLKILQLDNTGITHILKGIENLANLESLLLHYGAEFDYHLNRVAVPREGFPYPSPKTLTASHGMSKLTKLEFLCVGCKSIETIPREFGLIPNLSELDLYGCCNLKRVPYFLTKKISGLPDSFEEYFGPTFKVRLRLHKSALKSSPCTLDNARFPSLKEAASLFILRACMCPVS